MWNIDNRIEYMECVRDLLEDADVQAMDNISQHVKSINCLKHSVFVSYLSFLMCRKFGLDYVSASRAGLLHDMHLCDWNEKNINNIQKLRIHPAMAYRNASKFGLNELEKDIILKHMWPVTIKMPRHRESFIVNLADKICTIAEITGIYKLLKADSRLDFRRRRLAANII